MVQCCLVDKTELVTSSMVSFLPSKTSCISKDLPTLMARSNSAAVFKQSERKHITQLLSEVRAAENPSLFHADDDSSDEIDELEALRLEEQELISKFTRKFLFILIVFVNVV